MYFPDFEKNEVASRIPSPVQSDIRQTVRNYIEKKFMKK